MPRKKMNPAQKKQTLSLTLSPDEIETVRWLAAETGKTPSQLAAELFQREAARLGKLKEKKAANTERDRLSTTAADTSAAAAMIRETFNRRK